ncbi:MAG: 30S ribosomal protein S16 [Candidatus Marinimicrobia bacterium]|nr:30S ribosomal protein S16 [Candidatus Neomarinimicrobiota bacterium]
MAVRIRLLRMGRKKKPFYRIVVMDSRTRRDGRYIDKVGHYDPLKKPAEVTIDRDKVINWLEKGAEPSKTVFNILQKEGIALDWHLIRNKASEHVRNVEMQKFELAKKLREDKEASVGGEVEEAKPEKVIEKESQPEKEGSAEEEKTEEKPVEDTTEKASEPEEEPKTEAQKKSAETTEVSEGKEPESAKTADSQAEPEKSEDKKKDDKE